jgi:hypothetical protein
MQSRMDQSGSFGDNSYTGAAYLFDVTTGNLLQSFTNPNPAFYVSFGSSVALSGNSARSHVESSDVSSSGSGPSAGWPQLPQNSCRITRQQRLPAWPRSG